MELKNYQQASLNDLERFLATIQETKDVSTAFNDFWVNHPLTPVQPSLGNAIEPYKNNIPAVPHICFKIPTAGGKTFMACNAIKVIYDAFHYNSNKAVVWLVPSITILDQTIKNLKDSNHPYRQKINAQFGNRVAVFDKAELLGGTGLNPGSIQEQLNILVLSFDSLRAKNKEERKVFQENSNLQSFALLLGNDDEISLMRVIQSLNPVVIIDESHNAESDLSIDMIRNLNPCFILDLTATPRRNSNVISFVDAMELKKANMVKLPVIVYNHSEKEEVISSALQLQHKLELQAKEEQKKGGLYIRPIVLFQAQPKNAEDNTTFEKLKEALIKLKIPAEQIKIKTANLNELKGIDLMQVDCPVRYIITVNALKEGWDCPFAYILASLADKSSSVDVEQILGRVLRQPYVTKHHFPLLNLCYVLTASAKFLETLDNIVKGLNKAGFSEKDYKIADPAQIEIAKQIDTTKQVEVFIENTEPVKGEEADIDINKILPITELKQQQTSVEAIEKTATEQQAVFENKVAELEKNNPIPIPSALEKMVKTFPIKAFFKEDAQKLALPQFFLKRPESDLFRGDKILEKEELLVNFKLSQQNIEISFSNISSELYTIDLDETRENHTPSFVKADGILKESILSYILDPARKDARVKIFSKRMMENIGNLYPIPDNEVKKYIQRILEEFNDAQFTDMYNKAYSYAKKIKEKIQTLSDEFAEKKFREFLDTDQVFIKSSFSFPAEIIPGLTTKDITKSLYEREGAINGFEESVINEVANLPNILFWTRNIERKGFSINGFINHYPDFIIQTKSGKTIILETKGDHLEAAQKIRLGDKWATKAGNNYRYFLVYNSRDVTGAYTLDSFMNIISKM
jgi:type III restriction enzyme